MHTSWQFAALAATGVAAQAYGSGSSGWIPSASSSIPTGSVAPHYGNATSTSTVTEPESTVYVTDWTTIYTTVCPATTEITSGESTYTSTFLTTSSITSILTQTSTAVASSAASVAPVAPSISSAASVASSVASSELSSVASSVSAASSSLGVTPVSSPLSSVYATTSSTVAAPSNTQVGNSSWGTLGQGCFPKWLPKADGTPYASAPWGNATTKNSDATIKGDVPITGVTRYYNFTLTRGRLSPDGVERDVILVNGQFPGPGIEANWGDILNITVNNEIYNPDEGTSLHWHGMLQRDTPWMDGVPGMGQCPIAPGHSFTYVFQAELYGSSWYHAHYSAQYAGGVAGPMTVYGPSQLDYDCDVGPVMLTDWYHIPYFAIVADAVGTDLSLIPPTSDSVLINGRNNFTCSDPFYGNGTSGTYNLASNINSTLTTYICQEGAQLSQFRFQAGKTHRLRLVNHGADGVQKFQVDGLELTVIAVDYVPVVPYTTDVATLGVAQRMDVLVTAPNDTTASYWMRTEDVGGITCGGSKVPLALAAIYNEDADTSIMPTSTPTTVLNTTICDISAPWSTPEYSITPSTPSFQQDLSVTLNLNSTGSYEWRLNNQTFRANFNHPILYMAAEGNVSYPYDPQWNVYNFNQNSSVIFNLTNDTRQYHSTTLCMISTNTVRSLRSPIPYART